MNLPPAPIRIAERDVNYGLRYIELKHGDQLRNNGFKSAYEFAEYVSSNFSRLKMVSSAVFLDSGLFQQDAQFFSQILSAEASMDDYAAFAVDKHIIRYAPDAI